MFNLLIQTLVVSFLFVMSVPAEAIPATVFTNDMYTGTSTIKKPQQQKQAERQKQSRAGKKKRTGKKTATIEI